MTPEALTLWLRNLKDQVNATAGDYPHNQVPGCPLPFFGDILTARVLTIGVNPSSTEFEPGRNWEAAGDLATWQSRMLNYFLQPGVPAHAWFETWSICLQLLGIGYACKVAAHLDVSPRPTLAMFQNPNTAHGEFRSMVEHDVKWFFELLSQLPQVQLILVAGPIPRANGKKQQLADFIHQQATQHGATWQEKHPLSELCFSGRPLGIRILFCPYETGVDGLFALMHYTYRNRPTMRRIIS